jgi:hypothetical protein
MTKSDVFYFVIAHLRAQGVQAKNEIGSCSYRTPEGLKCAAGCLIPDDEYNPEFEGSSWATIASHFPQYEEYRDMITDLQLLHDGCYQGFDSLRFSLAVAVLETEHLHRKG